MKQLIFTLFFFLAFNQISNAQGQTCLPTDPDYCNPPCAVVCEIDNQIGMRLDFSWGYQGGPCSDDNIYNGYVQANSNVGVPNLLPWVGPCMRFCDQSCECPTLFRLLDPNTKQPIEPWDDQIFSWPNQTITYTTSIIYCDSLGCNPVKVDVTMDNGCVKFRFYT